VGNDRWLMPDGGNVAAMLYRFKKEEQNPAYRRILGTVRQIAPFLADFELEPTGSGGKEIILNWRDRQTGEVLGAHQLSDGTLRFISLATLFEDYDENVHGPLLTHAIGLSTLRARCRHFGQWLTRLEQLDQGSAWEMVTR